MLAGAGLLPMSTLTLVVSVPIMAGGAVLALLGAWNGYAWIRMGSMEATDVAAAGDGFVKLTGTVAGTPDGQRIAAPYTGVECVGYSYTAQFYRADDDSEGWVTAAEGTHLGQFLLDDGTGTALVDPEHASVRLVTLDFDRTPPTLAGAPGGVVSVLREGTRIGGKQVGPVDMPTTETPGIDVGGYRFTEARLEEGDQVYVVGPATTDRDATIGDARLAVRVEDTWRYWGPFEVSDWEGSSTDRDRLVGAGLALAVGLAIAAGGLVLALGAL